MGDKFDRGMMEGKICPNCRTGRDLVRKTTLLIYLGNWPLALLFSVIVVLFGRMLALEHGVGAAFAAIAMIPAIAEIKTRTLCERCNTALPEKGEKAKI